MRVHVRQLHGIDSLLCFYRHGREDLHQERFIDAFYDFSS